MKIKKSMSVLLTMMLLFSINTGPGYAQTGFSDTQGHWSAAIVEEAAGLGIVSGYTDGTFLPENLMKREEFFKLVSNVLTSVPDIKNTTLNFSDVDPIEWYVPTIKIAVEAGITSGYGDGKVGIGQMISRQEAAKIVASVIPDSTTGTRPGVSSVSDAALIADWAYPYVDELFKKGYMQGDGGSFKPTKALTRAEAATMLLNVKKNEPVIVGSKGSTEVIPKTPTSGAVTTPGGLSGSGSKSDPYVISTAEQLDQVREYSGEGIFFALKNDISITADLATGTAFDETSKSNWSDGNFTPIGSKAEPFAGYFDGKGYSIKGLEIEGQVRISGDVSMANNAGLFSCIGEKAVIENIVIEDAKITGKSNTGAIAGYNAGIIENCTVEKDVEVNGDNQTGGIAGSSDGILKGNVNKGDVTGTGVYTGGIAGMASNIGVILVDCTNKGTITGADHTGGIVGMITGSGPATMADCTNSGEVESETANAGGIAGIVNYKGISVENCRNTGDITSKTSGGIAAYNKGQIDSCYNSGAVKGSNYAGGIAGDQSQQGSKIVKCYNTGEVHSANNAGGIAGCNETRLSHCYNTGEVSGSTATGGIVGRNKSMVWNVYTTGKVTGSTGAGALAGQNSGEIERAFWLEGSADADTGLNDSGSSRIAVKKLTADELSGKTNVKVMNEDASIVDILNKDQEETIWRLVSGDTYIYPQIIM